MRTSMVAFFMALALTAGAQDRGRCVAEFHRMVEFICRSGSPHWSDTFELSELSDSIETFVHPNKVLDTTWVFVVGARSRFPKRAGPTIQIYAGDSLWSEYEMPWDTSQVTRFWIVVSDEPEVTLKAKEDIDGI